MINKLNIRYLYGFEEYCRSAQIQFRTVHHNEPRPESLPGVKSERPVINESEATEEVREQVKAEPATSGDGHESDAESEKGHKDSCSPRVSFYRAALRMWDCHTC